MEVERRIVRGGEDRGAAAVLIPVPREDRGMRDRALAVEDRDALQQRRQPSREAREREDGGEDGQQTPAVRAQPCSCLRDDQYTMPPMTMTDKTVTARSTTATAIESDCARPNPCVST